jgi:ClpP class serine protease
MPPAAFGEEFDIFFYGAEAAGAYDVEGKYAVVSVKGPLEQHQSFWTDSYDSIRGRLASAFASGEEAVALRINSPGGSFAGCLELAREVRAMAAKAQKPLVAFVDSQCLSAGYALACGCGEIVITPSASVGSVGVWSALVDATAADAARGLKVEIIASDAHKADRSPHVAMTEESKARLRAEVEDMAEMFREEAAEGRGIRPSSLRKLKGASVFGAQAIKAKLADRMVDSWQEFLGSESKSQAKNGANEMSLYSKAAIAKAAAEGDKEAAAMLVALAKADDDGDDEAKKAKKAKDEEEEKKAKAISEGTKSKKAKEDAPIKDGDEKDSKALSDVIARVQAMEATAAAREAKAIEDDTRAKLLAQRPDFSDAVLEVLALAPISALEKAVKDFPKSTFRNPNTAAAQAHGTAGKDAGDLGLGLPADIMAALDRKMPLGGKAPVAFSVGCGDPEAARKFLAAQAANNAKGG